MAALDLLTGHPSRDSCAGRDDRLDTTEGGMAVDLARWQFAITTVYHFLFVPP